MLAGTRPDVVKLERAHYQVFLETHPISDKVSCVQCR